MHLWCLYGPHIFKNMLHKTDMPNKLIWSDENDNERKSRKLVQAASF